MKRPIMALLGRALSALPSFLRRSSAAIAVGAVLLVGVGMITGIIPNIIAALQAQALAYRISSENEVTEHDRHQATVNLENENTDTISEVAKYGYNSKLNDTNEVKDHRNTVSADSIYRSASEYFPNPYLFKWIALSIQKECQNNICTGQNIVAIIRDDMVQNVSYTYSGYERLDMLNKAFQLHEYGVDLVKYEQEKEIKRLAQ